MDREIVIGNRGNGGLGDLCFFTPSFRNNKGKIILHDDIQSRQVSTILKGVCDVEFSQLPPERPEINCNLPIHRSRKIMYSLGINDIYCVPWIRLKPEELDWADNFIKSYIRPFIIINDNGGSWDSTNYRSKYVRGNPSDTQDVCDKLVKLGYTPLQVGRQEKDKFTPLNNAIHIQGLDLRKTGAIFNKVGLFYGTDSGLYHYMLACGGKCIVSIPEHNIENWGYDYNDLLYTKECFGNEKVRVKYFKHQNH